MADCHRRAFRRQLVKAASGPTTRDGATVQPPLPSEDAREVYGGLSCEIVSDLCPNPFSHDWHVQPSCQRPNRLPPERRALRSRRTHYESESGCPRNLLTISSARNPVNLHIPQHLHMFSTCGICSDWDDWGALGPQKRRHSESGWKPGEEPAFRGGSLQRATLWSSAWDKQSTE